MQEMCKLGTGITPSLVPEEEQPSPLCQVSHDLKRGFRVSGLGSRVFCKLPYFSEAPGASLRWLTIRIPSIPNLGAFFFFLDIGF